LCLSAKALELNMSTNRELPDSPVMIKLKEADDKYLAIQREFDQARSDLAKRYTEKQQEFLIKRSKLLKASSDDTPKTGTPALPGFWCKAMKHHEAFEDKIKEWDEPVLEHMTDVEVEKFDPETKGFKVIFRFSENEYFSNTELCVEYHSSEANPYLDTMEVEKVVATKIDWKPGKDVTVKTVAKKAKGGGAKKTKQKKEVEKPQDSFFRDIASSLHKGMTLAEIAAILNEDENSLQEIKHESMLLAATTQLMESHFECGIALRDNIVPFAVRFYTGEACVADDSDDGEDGESEENSDDDDSEDSDASEEVVEPKAKAKASAGKKKGGSLKGSPEMKPQEPPKDAKGEDCKQQ